MQFPRTIDDTFCIAVLGDFLGGPSGSPEREGESWVPLRATPDTVMKLAGLQPRIRLGFQGPNGAEAEEVMFSALEDFHPRALFQKLTRFRSLREAREVALTAESGKRDPQLETEGEPALPLDASRGGLLDSILEASQPAKGPPLRTPEELNAFVREAVRPHLVRGDTDVRNRVAAVDEIVGRHLSDLLHEETFQRLEGIWRSLVFLLSRIDTTGKVRVYLVHVPMRALREELEASSGPGQSRLFDLLSSPQLGTPDRRWALAVGAYRFSLQAEDISILDRIAQLAQAAGVPWISAVEPLKDGDAIPGFSEPSIPLTEEPPGEWTRFRERPEAAWLALTFPRFLLREPHEETSRRPEDLGFREKVTRWEDLLWGGGPFLLASLIAQGFVAGGWSFPAEDHMEVGGMPLAAPSEAPGGAPRSLEYPLTPGAARELMEWGITPLVGFPDRAGIRVGGFRTAAAGGTSLSAVLGRRGRGSP